MNESVTEVIVEQPLALPGSANNMFWSNITTFKVSHSADKVPSLPTTHLLLWIMVMLPGPKITQSTFYWYI